MKTLLRRFLAALAGIAIPAVASALTINVDFSDDTTGFFAQTPIAEEAVLKAAADLGAVIGPSLSPVTSNTFTGTNGNATVSMAWHLNYTNPDTGLPVTLNTFSFPANTVTIYAGVRPLSAGSDDNLAQGGPAGAGVHVSYSYVDPAQLPGAVANAQAASNAVNSRGGGAVQGTLAKSIVAGGVTSTYVLPYGAMVGSVAFNDDPLNTGSKDSAAALASYWHYDPFTPVESNKNDFYTVALHEIMHAIGFGTSQTWNSLTIGGNWFGSHASALHGNSGIGIVTTDGHIVENMVGRRLSDGAFQTPVMVPALLVGTRSYLTDYDLAFLHDIGYAMVPEPGIGALLLIGTVLIGRRGRQAR